ncbi:MAG: radical SAM protein [Proteobacteria bacterium]|nr:radical SAM protein [Pseudomonadota bacterium]
MKITLILAAAPDDPLRKNDPFMPLSLPLLAASAPDHDYRFVDMLRGETPDFDDPVDLVGISARITAEKTAYEIADRFRRQQVKVVLGGAQISAVPHRALTHADAVAVGEGEGIWPVIVRDCAEDVLKDFYVGSPLPFDAGAHTVHRSDGFLDLSTIPNTIQSRKIYKKKYTFDTVFSARGCAVDCDFCGVGQLFGKKTRLRPIDQVIEEIETFRDFYFLLDDTVFGRPHNYGYYRELYERIAGLKKVKLWSGQANLDAASSPEGREVIRKAANAGLIYTAIGMESINSDVLKKTRMINKMGIVDPKRTTEQMKENIRFIQEQGIAVSGWFTIGYDEDRIETAYEILQFCQENQIIPILCPLEAFPGTPLFERLNLAGRISETKKINIIHPHLKDEKLLTTLNQCNKQAFSLRQIAKRTAFYRRKLKSIKHDRNTDVGTTIKKTIFYFILQTKLKRGLFGLVNSAAKT